MSARVSTYREGWNGRGMNGKLLSYARRCDAYGRTYYARRAQGYKASHALETARERARMDDGRAWSFIWLDDDRGRDGDCIDNASVLNRCEFKHGGRHIERGSREACDCYPNAAGHRHGTLYDDCPYASRNEVSACALVAQCERHDGRDDYDPWTCHGGCEVLDALHGIEESGDNRERDEYRRVTEDELLSVALHNEDKEQREMMAAARMDVATVQA